jgi:hypothetical protein
MHANRFNEAAYLLTALPSRRDVLRGLVAAGLGLGGLRLPEAAETKKKHKKKPKKNAFGCLNVGQKCRGKSGKCCSGICQGKKPKKGTKDNSKCVAHNEGGCTPERSICLTGSQASLCGPEAACLATTGNAGFCANLAGNSFSQEANCRVCGTSRRGLRRPQPGLLCHRGEHLCGVQRQQRHRLPPAWHLRSPMQRHSFALKEQIMDADRFDAIAKFLIAATSRRRTLGGLLGGTLGLLSLTEREDAWAKSGKCKPKCDECEKCKKGDCDRKNGKKKCKKGKCQPKPAGTPCTAFPGGACQDGTCVNLQADEANCGSLGTVCSANQVCQAGSCFPRSTCPANTTVRCISLNVTECGAVADTCNCSLSAEGNVVCVAVPAECASLTPCTSSVSCPAGQACVEVGSCCSGVPAQACLAPCPAPMAA